MRFKLITIALLVAGALLAQSPQMFSFQAVIYEPGGDLVANSTVGVQVSILQGAADGPSVFTETHAPMSNSNGLISLEVGQGTLVSGGFATIDWGNGPYFLKTETDPEGGTNYTITGSQQMLSVPYALYAENSGESVIVQGGSGVTVTGNGDPASPYVVSDNSNIQPVLGLHYIIAFQGLFPSPSIAPDDLETRSGSNPYLGEIILFAGNFAPQGWAFCDGQLLAIASNSALFSLLGTTYGGDGETTFALPDLRSRVPVHPGTGPGLSNYSLGEKTGAE